MVTMARRTKTQRDPAGESPITLETLNPYAEMWRALSPGQRSRRSWRLRSRLKNLEAIHDAKSLPEL